MNPPDVDHVPLVFCFSTLNVDNPVPSLKLVEGYVNDPVEQHLPMVTFRLVTLVEFMSDTALEKFK